MSRSPCFGIDLGTTCSAIGRVTGGVPRIVRVDGEELLPSVVVFPPGAPELVGRPAVNVLALQPERAVQSSKRWMGTEHRFDVGEGRVVSPVDVAERILRALADAAEAEGGIRPERVVITVPAWFTQTQRADTRLAGERAGFTVERIVNEPTAAALAHAHGQDRRARVLVYDFGGGTFDVSLVEQDGPIVEVRASHGDSRLGGDDIDEALAQLVLRRLEATDRALREAVDASRAARVRLRSAVEAAKVALSEVGATTVRVPFLLELDGRPRHLEVPLAREDVDEASAPFVERTLACVDRVLADAGVSPSGIDELLLVGGTTLQPCVWHALHERYGLEGSHAIPPRRAVVLGAAIQAAIVDGSRTDGILVDVAPYPLSAGALDPADHTYACRVLTPRNAPLPSRHTEVFETSWPGQRELQIEIFQGSSRDPRKNTLLGHVRMTGLPPAPPGEAGRPIAVEFRHDLDGLVQVEVTDQLTGRSARVQLAADGAEQAELRRAMEEAWERAGLEPAEDLSADETSLAPAFGASSGGAPAADGDEAEAERTFEAVLAAADQLRADHPSEVEALLGHARAGLEALREGRATDAIERYDQLSDQLFSLGIWL